MMRRASGAAARRGRGVAVLGLAGGLLLAPVLKAAPCPEADLETLWRASKVAQHRAPEPAEVARSQALFEREFASVALPTAQEWAKAGFTLLSRCADGHHLRVLRDAQDAGQGFFIFNPTPRRNVVIQAPHRDSDLRSGEIALRLFVEGGLRAGAWNTVHRRGPERQSLDTDLAHVQRSHFQALTAALARKAPEARLLQLHGYAQQRRRSAAGRASQLILSAGRREVSAAAADLHACLVRRFGTQALLYPTQVQELGGTTNAQSRLLQAQGHGGFLHLELSRPLREELVESPPRRRDLLECLDG